MKQSSIRFRQQVCQTMFLMFSYISSYFIVMFLLVDSFLSIDNRTGVLRLNSQLNSTMQFDVLIQVINTIVVCILSCSFML